MNHLIQLLMAFLGSLGFAGIFNIRRDRLILAAFGGLLAWSVYLMLAPIVPSDVPRYFISSLCLTIYAEIMARIKKTPTTVFIVPAAVPLIPGGSLYTTMRYIVEGRRDLSIRQAAATAQLAGAIACGIIVAMTLWTILLSKKSDNRS